MAAELASAYISLVPSFRGGAGKIADELGGPVEKAGHDAGERAGKKASSSFGDAFKTGVKAAVGTAAVWGGGQLLANGFQLALDQSNLPGKLSAQFGLAAPAAGDAAKVAGQLYAQGWGESLNQVGEATAMVGRALAQLGTNEDVGKVTKQAQALSEMFGEELPDVLNSASKLVKTGLAPNMSAALDVITVGFQKIPEAAGDGLDTITEYAVQFQHLGLDASTAMGLIGQAARAGARDTDFIADALKEFGIRAVDGSKLSADSFKSLGLDAKKMAQDIGAGGTRASGALDVVLERLRGVKDPVMQSQIAVGLFGTKAEDLQKALLALDPSTAAADLGVLGGEAQKVADTVGSGLQVQLEQVSRSFDTVMAGALTAVLPHIQKFLDLVGPHMDVLGPAAVAIGGLTAATWLWNAGLGAVLKTGAKVLVFILRMTIQLVILTARVLISAGVFAVQMGAALASASVAMGRYLVQLTLVVARTVAGWIVMGTQALIQAARMALAWLIALGPIGIVIAAVVALVALIILNWQRIVDAITVAWNFVANLTTTVWNAITGAISAALSFIGGIFSSAWEGIKSGLGAALRWISDRWNDLVSFVTGIPERIGRALGSLGGFIRDAFKGGLNVAIDFLNWGIDRINSLIHGVNIINPFSDIPSIPHVARLAEGGITRRPTLAMVGEGGESEAVMPLSKLDSLLADRGAAPTIVINGAGLERHLQAWLRQSVRVQGGGSVQAAFGRA